MANSIAIVGFSGTGKSTSFMPNEALNIKGLNPKETHLINVSRKPLPAKGWKSMYSIENKNYFETENTAEIIKRISDISEKGAMFKNIVIDDAQYLMAFEFMRRAKDTGYGKFADIGANMGNLMKTVRESRPNLNVIFLWHPDEDKEGNLSMKTVGKMVDDYLTLEGLFTTILYTDVAKTANKMAYRFVTNNDGRYPAKSPYGMFESLYIPNDMGVVIDKINEYNS